MTEGRNTESGREHVETISRRNVLLGALGAAAAGTSLLAVNSFAASHGDHGDSHGSSSHAGHQMTNLSLVDAAAGCIKSGQICSNHCVDLVKAGDTSIARCLETVSEMLASCTALAQLASFQSPHLPAFAKVCISICEDCEKECRKHEDKHAACRNCAESCKECIAACKKIAA